MKDCRTCKHLAVRPDKLGRIVPRKNEVYRCLAPEPDLPPIPLSVSEVYDFKWPPRRTMVTPDHGKDCPVWEKRDNT